jgi:Astacin (Peptidase family M12A)
MSAGGPAMAQEDTGPSLKEVLKMDLLPPRLLAGMKEATALMEAGGAADEQSKGTFVRLFQWPASIPKLRVCFFGGNQEQRETIRKLASEWEGPDNSIKFDWGKKGFRDCEKAGASLTMHIRVGFDEPGFFSAYGSLSVFTRGNAEKSLNLEGFDKMTAKQIMTKDGGYWAGTVRHEFGHAIGLFHEHQSPKSTCEDDFDWDAIYKTFSQPPENWDKAKIDSQLRRLTDPDIDSTRFDPLSVMKYYYDPKMFKNGKESSCYVPQPNNVISELDRKTVAFMYPPRAQSRAERFEADRAMIKAALAKAEENGAAKSAGAGVAEFLLSDFPAEAASEED